MELGQPLRVLLLDAKPPILHALAARPELDVTVLCSAAERPWFLASGCDGAVAEIPYVLGDKLNPGSIRSVRKAIKRLRPDVVHAFYPKALAHVVAATIGMSGRPKIVSYRGVTAPAHWWSPIQWVTYRSANIDAHACESGAVRDSLVLSGVPKDKCAVVYNCLNGPLRMADRADAYAAWGVPEDAFVVAMSASMRPVKGADVLLRAALECTDLADVHWVLMGRVLDAGVTRLAADPRLKGLLHLVGFHSNAASLVSGADVFVMPSRAEALSVALLEAMAQGVCPVVSDAGGMKEAVRDKRDGLVFPSGDSVALAQCIRRLRQDDLLRRRLATSARRRIADEFSPAAVAARIVEIYLRVANVQMRVAENIRKAA